MNIENSFVIDQEMLGDRRDVRADDFAVDPEVARELGGLTNEAIHSVVVDGVDGTTRTVRRSGGRKVYANDLGLNDPQQEDARAARLNERKAEVCEALAEIIYERVVVMTDNGRRGPVFNTPIGASYFEELKGGMTSIEIGLGSIGVPLRDHIDDTLVGWIENELGNHLSAKLQAANIDGEMPFADSSFKLTVNRNYPFMLSLNIERLN